MLNRNQEKKLVKRAQRDPRSFARLYNFYFPKIYRFVVWRVGHRADVEDLVSDVFFKALKNLSKFHWQKEANFGSWLFRIARNTIIDYYRSREKRKFIDLEDIPEIRSQEILPQEQIQRKELFQKLQKLTEELPRVQKETIILRFFAERKNKEIAEILGSSEKTVASNLCRALRTLHKKYKKLQ